MSGSRAPGPEAGASRAEPPGAALSVDVAGLLAQLARSFALLLPVYALGYLGLSFSWVLLALGLLVWCRRSRGLKATRLCRALALLEDEERAVRLGVRACDLPAWVSGRRGPRPASAGQGQGPRARSDPAFPLGLGDPRSPLLWLGPDQGCPPAAVPALTPPARPAGKASGVPTHHYPARVGSPPARWVRGLRPPLLRLGRGSRPPGQGFLPVLAPPERTPPESGSLPSATPALTPPARPPGQGFLPVLTPPESGSLLAATLTARPVGCPGSSPPLPGPGSPLSSTPPTWGVLSPGRRRPSEPCKSGVAAAVAGPPAPGPLSARRPRGRAPSPLRAGGPEHR